MKTKKAKGKGMKLWQPLGSWYYLHALDRKKGIARVRNQKGSVLKAKYPINCVRKWRGK